MLYYTYSNIIYLAFEYFLSLATFANLLMQFFMRPKSPKTQIFPQVLEFIYQIGAFSDNFVVLPLYMKIYVPDYLTASFHISYLMP